MPVLLTVAQAAARVGCSTRTIYKEIKCGNLPAHTRRGRVRGYLIKQEELYGWYGECLEPVK